MRYTAVQMPVVRELNTRSIGVTPQILSTAVISTMTTYIDELVAGARSCLGLSLGPAHRSAMGERAVPGCAHIHYIVLLDLQVAICELAFFMTASKTLHLLMSPKCTRRRLSHHCTMLGGARVSLFVSGQ